MQSEVIFTNEPIAIPASALVSREIGAVVEFRGVVRSQEKGRALEGLNYEAYEAMARRVFDAIFADLAREHPVESVTVIHRLGWVPVGDASLYVCVQAKHRGEALAFCGALIDRMKEDVPIWKMAAPE